MVFMLLVRTAKSFRIDYRGISSSGRGLAHVSPWVRDAPGGGQVERSRDRGESRLSATSTGASQRVGAKGSEQDTDDDDDDDDAYDEDGNGSGLRSSGSPSRRKQAIDIEIAALVAARRPPPKRWIDRQGVVTTVASSSLSQVKIVTYNCLGPLHGTKLNPFCSIPDFLAPSLPRLSSPRVTGG
jgi:hypothetical protein